MTTLHGALTSIYAVEFLTQILRADPMLSQIPGGIWHEKRPAGRDYPYIVFSDASSKPILGVGAATVAGDGRFLVKVVGEVADGQDIGVLVPWTKRLTEVLEEASGTIDDDIECQGLFCETPILYPETTDERKTLWHIGGIWSLFLS